MFYSAGHHASRKLNASLDKELWRKICSSEAVVTLEQRRLAASPTPARHFQTRAAAVKGLNLPFW